MNWFKICKYICKEIDKTKRGFFWNKDKERKGDTGSIPTIAWDKNCRPKCKGVLGIQKTGMLIQLSL